MTCLLNLILHIPNKVLDVILGPEEQIAYVSVTTRRKTPRHDPDQPLLREGALGARTRRAAYIEEPHVQGVHQLAARRAGGGDTVPVLVTDEGVFAQSEWIVRYADAHLEPEQRLFTGDQEIDALCRWLDAGLGPDARRLIYKHMLPRKRLMLPVQQPGRPGLGSARAERALPGRDALGAAGAEPHRHATTPRSSSPRSTRSPSGSPTAAATCAATASPPRT